MRADLCGELADAFGGAREERAVQVGFIFNFNATFNQNDPVAVTYSCASQTSTGPFTQANGQLLFVTFSSKIDYGFALVNSGTNGANRAQLWMAAVDLRTATTGGDPSLPPVWLPFQDITETNHLPFWTSVVACAQDGISYASCGAGEICDQGACTVVSP